MKTCKRTVAIALVLIMLFCLLSPLTVQANNASIFSNEILPTTIFTIDDNGLAEFSCNYVGIQGVTTRIEITVQMQKKTLLWWSDVEYGRYFFEKNDYQCAFWTSKQLSKSGKYRIVVDYTVYGTNGSADTITVEKEASY